MKITKQQLRQIIKEELTQALYELGGMSSKDFAKMDDSAAMALIKKQKKDPYSVMSKEQLDKIIDNHRNPGSMKALRKLTDANKARKEIYGIEDAELESEIGESWEQFERSPGYGGAPVGGKY
mgnify:CR=1 FL=1